MATEADLEEIRLGFLKGGVCESVAFSEAGILVLVADKGRRWGGETAGRECGSGVVPARNVDFRFMNWSFADKSIIFVCELRKNYPFCF